MLNLIYNENIKEAQRLFHGRGKIQPEFAHINIDYFYPVILITLYRECSEDLLNSIKSQLESIPQITIHSILIQKRYLVKSPMEALLGAQVSELVISENDLLYKLNLGSNQNIGFFVDMKLGREQLVKYCKGKKILNLFAYTCSFSVAALKHGAREVVNIDMSKAALERGRENHLLNDCPLRSATFLSHDIFKSFGLIKKLAPFDLVILDPPTDQGESFQVERDYPKLLSRLKDWIPTGGIVMTCLNSPFHTFQYLEESVLRNAPSLELIERCGAPASFLETIPDSGLKIIFWKMK